MAFETVRTSVLGIEEESTEGTAIAPTSSSDYIAIQDDLAITPDYPLIDNPEVQSALGRTKGVLGIEAPKFSMSHNVRHSGVEGQAPNHRALFKGVFGEENVESTEYNTVASSTVSAINVDTGEGAQFGRGHGLLVKDPTNGHSIRATHSVSSDVLTPGFNLPGAPATGVNLGKAVWYAPVNTGFPSFSLWHYIANRAAVELVTGVKMVNLEMTWQAGERISMSINGEGLSYIYNPIIIAAADRYIDWNDGTDDFAAAIPAGTYSPKELARALEAAMRAQTSAAITVTYSDTTGKFTITSDDATFELHWNSGTNTANTIGDKIGFSTGADDTGAQSYTSDSALSFAAPHTPSYDDTDFLVARNMDILLGEATDTTSHECSMAKLTLALTKQDVMNMAAANGRSGQIITAREVDMSLTTYVKQYEVSKFDRYVNNTEGRLQLSFGTKVGGNWVAGKCGYVYMPAMTLSQFDPDKEGDIATLNLNARAFVKGGLGEIYLGFL